MSIILPPGTVGCALTPSSTWISCGGLITVHSPITAQATSRLLRRQLPDGDIVLTDSSSDVAGPEAARQPRDTTKFHTTNLTKTLVPSPVGPAVQPTTLTMPALTPTDTAALDVGFQSYWIEAVWDDDPAALPAVDRRKTITRGVMYILAQRTA